MAQQIPQLENDLQVESLAQSVSAALSVQEEPRPLLPSAERHAAHAEVGVVPLGAPDVQLPAQSVAHGLPVAQPHSVSS